MVFFAEGYDKTFKMPSPPLHDPCTIAYIIEPGIMQCEYVYVGVERKSSMCDGRTLCDLYNMCGKKPNVRVGTKINVDRFWELMADALAAANKSYLAINQ